MDFLNYRLPALERNASQVDGLKEAVRARLARWLNLDRVPPDFGKQVGWGT